MTNLETAAAAVLDAVEVIDRSHGVQELHRALAAFHRAARDAGAAAPLWNTARGAVQSHLERVLATVPGVANG